VNPCLGIDVVNHNALFVFVHNVGGNFPVDDLTEEAFFRCHSLFLFVDEAIEFGRRCMRIL
jgi:hypothetical protein